MITRNESSADRIIRLVLAAALGVVALTTGLWWVGVVALIPLATGLIGWCPLYSLFGISTCPVDRQNV